VVPGMAVPGGCLWRKNQLRPGETVERAECEPELWLGAGASRKVVALSEQVLRQANGFSMLLLNAELRDEQEGWTGSYQHWWPDPPVPDSPNSFPDWPMHAPCYGRVSSLFWA
jgi:hypothetical protein